MTVNDLTGTDVREVGIDLAGTIGGDTGDGAGDTVDVKGTNGDDTINLAGNGSGADLTGLTAGVSVVHGEQRADALSVDTLAGDDHVQPSGVFGIQVFVDGAAIG